MKLIMTIVSDADSTSVSQALIEKEFRVTLIASTGGFLRRGQNTLLVGCEDEKTEEALQIIRESVSHSEAEAGHRASIFVVKVDDYIHF